MDWTLFFMRNGYGLYIWGSIGMCAAVFVAEVLALRARRRALQGRVAQMSQTLQMPAAHPSAQFRAEP